MDFLKDITNPFSLTLGIVFVLYLALKSYLAFLSKGYKKEKEALEKENKHLKGSVTRYKKLLK